MVTGIRIWQWEKEKTWQQNTPGGQGGEGRDMIMLQQNHHPQVKHYIHVSSHIIIAQVKCHFWHCGIFRQTQELVRNTMSLLVDWNMVTRLNCIRNHNQGWYGNLAIDGQLITIIPISAIPMSTDWCCQNVTIVILHWPSTLCSCYGNNAGCIQYMKSTTQHTCYE